MGSSDTMIVLAIAALAMFSSSGAAIGLWAYGNAGTGATGAAAGGASTSTSTSTSTSAAGAGAGDPAPTGPAAPAKKTSAAPVATATGTGKPTTATAGKKLSPVLAAKVAAAAAASKKGPASASYGPASLAIMNDAGDQALKFIHPYKGTAKVGTSAVFYDDPMAHAFTYADGMLKHRESGLCLATADGADSAVNDMGVIFAPCEPSTDRVKWTFGNGQNKGQLKHRGVNGDVCVQPRGGSHTPKNDTKLVFYDNCSTAVYPFSIG